MHKVPPDLRDALIANDAQVEARVDMLTVGDPVLETVLQRIGGNGVLAPGRSGTIGQPPGTATKTTGTA